MRLNGVYCLTSPSGKRYVGIAVRALRSGILTRFRNYKKLDCADQPRLFNALKKYGWDSFKKEVVLLTDDRERAGRIEKQLIALWGLNNPARGYNITVGGDGVVGAVHAPWTEERKRAHGAKVRAWYASHTNPQLGVPKSAEHRAAIGKGRAGRPSGMLGKHHSNDTKRRLSAVFKGRPAPWARGKGRPVCRDDGVEYPSLRVAAEQNNVNMNSLCAHLHGRSALVGGRTFCYADTMARIA